MEAWMNDVPRAVVAAQRELRASVPDLAGRYQKLSEALRDEVAPCAPSRPPAARCPNWPMPTWQRAA